MSESLEDYIARLCWSDYDGCICGLDKGHDGLHCCPAEDCARVWTDTDARDWAIALKEDW